MKSFISFFTVVAAFIIPVNTAFAAVKVGVFDNSPIVMKSDENITGFSIDILEVIAEKEGWEIEYIHDTFKHNFKRLKNNQIDLIVGLAYTEERNKDFYYTQETLLNNWGVVFQTSRGDITSIKDLINKKVVLINNNIHGKVFDSLMQKFGFNYYPVYVATPVELSEMLKKNKADAGVINRLTSINFNKQHQLKPTSIIFNPVEVRYASSRKASDSYVKTIDGYLHQWKQDKQSFYYQSLQKWLNGATSQASTFINIAVLVMIIVIMVAVYVFYLKKIFRRNTLQLDFKQKEQTRILESLADGAIIIDQQGMIFSFNKAAEKMFGYRNKEVLGKNIKMLMPESTASHHDDYLKIYMKNRYDRVVGKGREVIARRANKETFPMRLSVSELPFDDENQIRFIGICVDLTTQKQQDKYFQRSQKMDALGQLTGGIAHDYNNMLGVILGYSELLKEKLDSDSRLLLYADQISRAADRGVSLTKKLLRFSRNNEAEREDVDINAFLDGEAIMLEKILTPRIPLQLELHESLRHVFIDRSELIEAIVNMTINAMHAMPDGGEFCIKTNNVIFDKSNFQFIENNERPDHVHIMLEDNGAGMTEIQQSRIFEPFFTTKGDKGTGLGMSQVYGFVTEHNGVIDLHSVIGVGTRFDIYLPVHQGEESKEINKPDTHSSTVDKKVILVVDDEESLLALVGELIVNIGYEVITANSGKEALELLINNKVDLLLTDIIMPDMDGYVLVKNVLMDFPEIKIQLMSGYDNIKGKEDVPPELLNHILKKPFSIQELSVVLQQQLDSD